MPNSLPAVHVPLVLGNKENGDGTNESNDAGSAWLCKYLVAKL
ncbi:hypothetical protein SAMN04490178_12728 [Propionispora vibrioides]|uniref:Uncharacterized protein n=1 Tax=Propionispora vibrioides TaxID=112903 RepID=A0A1H8XQB1_9FIRM|nr:hypothetical protein SAMN04490178_12728 [Propionispora vibrioides]